MFLGQTPLRFLGFAILLQKSNAFAPPPGLTQRPSGLQPLGPVASNGLGFEDLVVGEGRQVGSGDYISMHYIGKYKGAFGKEVVFENSRKDKTNRGTIGDVAGEPIAFPVGKGSVIKGWELGILGDNDEIPPMKVGGKRQLKIPAALAYGEEGRGAIPANQDLVFDLELVSIDIKDSLLNKAFTLSIQVAFSILILNTIYLKATGQG